MNARSLRFQSLSLVLLVCATAWADGKLGTATIKGKITVPASQPAVRPIDMAATELCKTANAKPITPQGKRIFADGSLPYAFVYLKSGVEGKYDPPTEPLKLEQKGCMYTPHVAGLFCGQDVLVVNSDNTSHNIHATPSRNAEFNFTQTKPGQQLLTAAQKFKAPEVMVRVKCDVHPWMSAYIGVLPHPFFSVTQQAGAYEIKNVPAGKYKLAVWHEEWSKAPTELDIEVKDGDTIEKNIELPKK